jgi:hypothetical protein
MDVIRGIPYRFEGAEKETAYCEYNENIHHPKISFTE